MQKNTKSTDEPSQMKRLHNVIYAQIYDRLKKRHPDAVGPHLFYGDSAFNGFS